MDFTNRGVHPHSQPGEGTASAVAGGTHGTHKTKHVSEPSSALRWLYVVFLFAVTVLIVFIIINIAVGGNTESKYLNTKDYQALDISVGGSNNGDQIYFGNIKSISSSFYIIDNVFYIPATTSGTSSSITLEPLVCQIDSPFDQMIVNRSSVNWWENLQSSSKVVSTITQYEKANPTSPTCPSSSTAASSTSSSAAATTPTTSSTAK